MNIYRCFSSVFWMCSFLWHFLLNGKFILCELHKILGTWRTVPKWYLIKSGQTCPGPNFFGTQLCPGITGQELTFLNNKKSSSFKYLLAFSRMCFEIFETSHPLCHNSRSNPWWKLHKILLLICSCVTLICKNMYSFKFKLFWSSALSRHNWAIIKSKLFSVFQISTWTLLWLHHCFEILEFSLQYFTKTWL